jgi:PAS domain S-box-containing protein
MTTYLILAGDLVLQLIAACLALRLIRVTGKAMAWFLVALVLVFMALHRGFTFYQGLFAGVTPPLAHDIICLATSGLMVAGLALISPLFRNLKATEDKLRRSEEKYRTIVETAHEGIGVADAQDKLVYVNQKLLDIFGYQASEMLGRPPLDFLPKDEGDRIRLMFNGAKQGSKDTQEFRAFRKDGAPIWVSVAHSGIFDQNGAYLGAVGLLSDITARKKAEETVKIRTCQQEAVATLGLNAIGGADLTALLDGAVTLVSPNLKVEFCDILEPLPNREGWRLRSGVGWRPGLVGTTVMEAGPESLAGDVLSAAHPVILADLRSETGTSHPPLLREHGIVSGLRVIIAGEKEPFGLLGAYTAQLRTFSQDDINFLQSVANVLAGAVAQRRSEQALHQSEQRLRFLTSQLLASQEKERGKLSLELHEELGQTLQVLKMQTSAIKKGLQEHQSGLGQECEVLARRLVETIERLRGLSWELSPHCLEDLGLGAALRLLIDDFHQHYQIKWFQADLDEIDDLFAAPEKITIFRIVQGALSNIGEHSQATHVTLDVRRKGDGLNFVLTDNGKGFETEDVMAKLGGARGFGLYAMEERVKMLGGVLRIHSRPGLGTELSFTLPISASG